MKVSVESIRILYRAGKITADGVRSAVLRGWITEQDFEVITGQPFVPG